VARAEAVLFGPNPRLAGLALAGLILAGGVAGALLVAAAGPTLALAACLALVGAALVLSDLRWGFVALFAVLGLAPFATLPFKIGFTPTFLDLALLALYFVWIMRLTTRRQSGLRVSILGAPILVFLVLAIFAFANGLQYSSPTPATLRNFVELMLGILGFFLVFNNVHSDQEAQFLARLIVLAGAVAAAIAVVLYVIPTTWTVRVLDGLTRFNYPGGAGALRYIEDDPANAMRAIGTQIDPNVLGGFLILVAAFTAPQLVNPKPLMRRSWVALCLGLEVLALYFSHSRGSLLGLAAAILLIGLLRYRKLLWLLVGGLALLLLVPQAQAYVAHFLEGLQLQDRATLMRLGEYKDALALIARYPWFGVGFTGSPDPSLYVGVSSVYLLMAEEMGAVGLVCFLMIVAAVVASLWRGWRRNVRAGGKGAAAREALLLGVGAAIVAVLAGGFFDHYLFNLVYPHMSTFFWIVLGLGMAVCSLVPPEARQPNIA
jgi:polysaccharide biosynthesis protein PslJ